MWKTFNEWLIIREMAGGGPYISGSVNRMKHPDFNVWGAQPNGKPEPQHMKKKSRKMMKK